MQTVIADETVESFDFFCAEIDRLAALYVKYYSSKKFESMCVAVSGGSDSMSLLVMAAEWARSNCVDICCVTVDHKLRAESLYEANFVKNFCMSLNINHVALSWNRESNNIKHGKLENMAREARYKLISKFCEDNFIPVLLTGHTWNDQLETFEMRKNAGSLASGLACMSQIRSIAHGVKLFRPILHFTKKHLEGFLKKKNICWISDPMNDQIAFLRVYYRKKISNYSNDKIKAISNMVIQFGITRNRIEKLAVEFLKKFCNCEEHGAVLQKATFLSHEKSVQAEILKRVIWSVGGKKYAPSITDDICDKIISRKINTIGRCLLKIKKQNIFVCMENRNANSSRKETIYGLPYAGMNYKVTNVLSSDKIPFVNKVNLFDIFV